MRTCAGVLFLLACAHAVTRDQFYPYDPVVDATLLKGSNVACPEIPLAVPIKFYGETYETIFVNNYGVITFRADIPTFLNAELPLPYPSIAVFYSNVDTTEIGAVYYKETNDPHILAKAEESVQNNFHEYYDYVPTSVFIATWLDVTYTTNTPFSSHPRNSFQIAIISNSNETFVELLYPEHDIQWIRKFTLSDGLPDAKAQVGFNAEDGRFYTLRGSGTHQIRNIVAWSNVHEPGKYVFRVGDISPDENIGVPEQYNESEIKLQEETRTCGQSAQLVCHTDARCIDFQSGICCQCFEGFYGNGKSCINKTQPLRIHGRLTGIVNDVTLEDVNLQAYVVVSDGRTYTALSQSPTYIGSTLQFLNVLGGVVGWIFAKPLGEAKNGYQLTGAHFNHTATLFFPQTGEKAIVSQQYSGSDVFDQIVVDATVTGNLPYLLNDTKLELLDYEEQYTHERPGIIRSESTYKYKNKLTGETYEQRVSQVITYESCHYAPLSVDDSKPLTLKVAKSYLGYETKDNIVRFGMANKITVLGHEDPCNEGRRHCGPHSTCVVQGDSYTCQCQTGYNSIYNENTKICIDIDECADGTHSCDPNADCSNVEGSFTCSCRSGFEGNGEQCAPIAIPKCHYKACDPNAQCIENYDEEPKCICKPGYTGDGDRCWLINKCDQCSRYATCLPSENSPDYVCQCNRGYTGDGVQCYVRHDTYTTTTEIPLTTPLLLIVEEDYNETFVLMNCDSNGCSCPIGYSNYTEETHGLYLCKLDEVESSTTIENSDGSYSCEADHDCPPNAICSFSSASDSNWQVSSTGHCVCPEGFDGDAYECIEREHPNEQKCTCGLNAHCVDNSEGEVICVCDTGYHGDGNICRPSSSCTNNSDCEYYAECRFTYNLYEGVCQCIEGYVKDQNDACIRDGQLCNGAFCTDHASCLYDENIGVSYCYCDSGYEGDGISQCVKQGNTCNIRNDCHFYAVCMATDNTYQCVCQDGYVGNGYSCTAELNCKNDPYMCDVHASCLKRNDVFVCECNAGYNGNGSHCELNPRQSGEFLVASDGVFIYRVPFETSTKSTTPINIDPNQIAVGIDVDCITGKVYWGDVTGNYIKRVSYDGTAFEPFLSGGIQSPEGLSIDWSARNIFWTDSKKRTVEVANLDTKSRKVLFDQEITNPRGIAVHPQRGKIFWTDWNRIGPKIEWANMDGSERGIFLDSTDVKLPNSLAIDWAKDRLCYADAGLSSIKCVGIDTLEKETIASNCSYPFGLAINGNTYYWTDWKTLKIEFIDTISQKKGQLKIQTAAKRLYGVAVAPDQCPNLSNVCQYRNGNCSPQQLCLPDGRGSRTCVDQ